MPKCPNCGRETHRTVDWACQWCGHPLLSGSFKKIPQTYRELQEERSLMPRAVPEDEPEPAIEAEVALAPPPEPEPEPEPETSPPPAPVVEAKAEVEVEKEPVPPPEPETETVTDIELAEATESVTVEEPEAAAEPETEPVTMEEPEAEPVAEAELETSAEVEPAAEPVTTEEPEAEPVAEVEPEIATIPAPPPAAVPSLEPDPATGAISATAEELNVAFNADKAGTNARLMNKLLKVTGNVDKIFAKDHLDIFYIILAGTRKPANWQVRCTFSREQGMYLSHLTEGQSATVQGTYAGYERNIILKDCTILQ
jgi:hypothetical protein